MVEIARFGMALARATKLAVVFAFALVGNAAMAQSCASCFWGFAELYSNRDGSVQFIVLESAVINGKTGRLDGLTLSASNGSTQHSFTFPANLPEFANRPILVATQGFADLNLVKPDFIVPNGFLFSGPGLLKLPDDSVYIDAPTRYDALPNDGVHALYPDAFGDWYAYTETAQAVNNAGDFYTFPLRQKLSGLWGNPDESGWAIAVDHQGDVVSATWATYDDSGLPTWLLISRAAHYVPGSGESVYVGSPNNYVGSVYQMTGPASGAVSGRSDVMATKVGVMYFLFSTNGDDSQFSYATTASNAADRFIAKRIRPVTFASPVPACVDDAAPGMTPNFQGVWWNASETGRSLHLTHQGDIVFATWFTYDKMGKATWLTMTATKMANATYHGTLYRTTGPPFDAEPFDSAAVTRTPVGIGTLTFTDRDNGSFAYSVDAVSNSENIARFIFAEPRAVCN